MKTEQEIDELAAAAHEQVMVVVREAQDDPDKANAQIRIDVAARTKFKQMFLAGRAEGLNAQRTTTPEQ